ncbi:unnamed protein product [Polarella glacialis]|uniref:Uncharacterized protein n=1 Tax=Polarella glacialis TaxID=89957 RepID=A0A813JAV0_POLGL|nr:unnamed protein product [Polarella glacialis]
MHATADLVETTTLAGGVLVEFTGERHLLVLSDAIEVSKYMLVFLTLAGYAPQFAEAVDKAIKVWRRAQNNVMFDCGQIPEANIPKLDLLILADSRTLDSVRHKTWRMEGEPASCAASPSTLRSALAAPSVVEAKARAQAAEEDGAASAAQLAERSKELRRELEAATSDAQRLEHMRQARRLFLEAEGSELRRKWQPPLPEPDQSDHADFASTAPEDDAEIGTSETEEQYVDSIGAGDEDEVSSPHEILSSYPSAGLLQEPTTARHQRLLGSSIGVPTLVWSGEQIPPRLPFAG